MSLLTLQRSHKLNLFATSVFKVSEVIRLFTKSVSFSSKTLKRQQEILTRLLEAEKSEQEREQDEKRQSNEAKSVNFSNPNLFKEYNMLKQREAELLRTVPPNLTQFYKNKVSEYLNNVSDSGISK